MRQLILGGARSGKSSLAERELLAGAGNRACHYLATAHWQQCDAEMRARIEHHRQARDRRWQTLETPLGLGAALQNLNNPDACVLVDCLTLWLSNALHEACWPAEKEAFLTALRQFSGQLILVSNEVGLGLVPLGELSRRFVDESGWLHQALGQLCERVVFVAAGLPLTLKG